jgi:hypothetical protein
MTVLVSTDACDKGSIDSDLGYTIRINHFKNKSIIIVYIKLNKL